MKIKQLDGKKLYYAFFYGRKEILKKQKYLNDINVFPVADGDTGTNLATTMHSIVEGSTAHPSVAEVSKGMADAAISGSRGNSGIIFAQFVSGLSEAVRDKEVLNLKEFSHAMKYGAENAYKALSKPVEGTILTVMRAWANALHTLHEKCSDFGELFHKSIEIAKKSLKDTPKKLKVLEQAGVVDAGADGFVSFLEGIAYFITHGKKPEIETGTIRFEKGNDIHAEVLSGKIPHRYCTEVLIQGDDLDADTIREHIENDGNSVVVAGSHDKVRIHIHTNTPSLIVTKMMPFGTIIQQKVEDMKRQYEARSCRKSEIVLVTDSTCDLPHELMNQYQVQMVPLNISFNEKQYLDKLTITPDQFYKMLDEESTFPKTSQPSVKMFENLYETLVQHYKSVMSLHLSDRLSGTLDAARIAAERFNNHKIAVIDSRHISISLGIIVKRISEEILKGSSHEEVVELIDNLLEKTKLLVSVKSLKYMVRGGRLSPLKGIVANFLNLKPIISLDSNGALKPVGKVFSRSKNIKKIIKMVAEHHKKNGIENYAIGHTKALKEAYHFQEKLEQVVGKKAEYIIDVSPVIGAHAGLGVLAVSFF
jgi:DegV family protein with EDD domain